jgi:hypothetical protein
MLKKSSWWAWLGLLLLFVVCLAPLLGDDAWLGLGTSAIFASVFAGIGIGGFVGRNLKLPFPNLSDDCLERLAAGGSIFGFLFLPPLVGSWTNAHLGTDIELHSLGAHFLWACICAGLGFNFGSSTPDDEKPK